MDTYPCPACGGPADAEHGCRQCGRPHDPDAAALALYQRTVASLEQKKRELTSDQLKLAKQLAHASAQRDTLRRQLRQRLGQPGPAGGGRRPLLGRFSRTGGATPASDPTGSASAAPPPGTAPPVSPPPSMAGPPPTRARATPAAPQRFSPRAPGNARRGPQGGTRHPGGPQPPSAGSTLAMDRLRRAIVVPQRPTGRRRRLIRLRRAPAQPVRGRVGGAEATTGSMQTALLALGGLLLAGAAVVLTVIAFATTAGGGRLVLLGVSTAFLLVLPFLLARRRLIATAETVAAVALLLVLLDGYVAWKLGLFGSGAIPTTVYFGLVCIATAGVATAYQATSQLVAPRYVTLLVLQPVIPLLAYDAIHTPTGWAVALSGVAVLDLAYGVALTTRAPITVTPLPPEPDQPEPAGAAEPTEPVREVASPTAVVVDPLLVDPFTDDDVPAEPQAASRLSQGVLRDVAWILFAIAYGSATAYAAAALLRAATVPDAVRAAIVALVAAAIGVAGGIAWQRRPVPDVTAGIATLAFVLSAARVSTVAVPGYALLFTAGAIALAALVVPTLPERTRRGPQVAGVLATIATGLAVIAAALPAVAAPVRAARPVWHANLAAFPGTVAAAVGPDGWQLFAAALLLTVAAALFAPRAWRSDATVAGLAVTGLIGPAALGLGWLLTPAVTVLAAVAFGVVALSVPVPRTAWYCLAAATALGTYATLVSLASPTATALTLTAITLAGTVIAVAPRAARSDPEAEAVAQWVSDAAGGGALFALPGAAAGAAAIAVRGTPPTGTPYVLVAAFLALAVTLGVVALVQVARQQRSMPLLGGATLATGAVGVATLTARGSTLWDMAVALLMVIAAALVWFAPYIDQRQTFGSELTGADTAFAAATVAGIAAVARAVTLAAPGSQLVTISAVVLAAALGTRVLPVAWRSGPIAGAGLVGTGALLWAGAYAVAGAVGVIRATNPVWHASLGADWGGTAGRFATYGWQVPVALLLIAVAAALMLPPPRHEEVTAAAIGLAAMGTPVGLHLAWTSPTILGWATATGLGVAAALARSPRSAYTRLATAIVVGVFAAGASLVRPAPTAGTLFGLALSAALVAALAVVTAGLDREASTTPYLTQVGGMATGGALLAFTGGCVAAAGALGYPSTILVVAAFAAASLGLSTAGLLCRYATGYLPYVTGGVAAGATITALTTVPAQLPAAVFAAVAALLGVLAELIRAGTRRPGRSWEPAVGGFRPNRTARPMRAWRPVREPGGFGYGVALASGVPAAIAVASVAPAVAAALLGPYRWVAHPWTGTPSTASDLGPFHHWTGTGTDVLAALILTGAAALAAIGLGGAADTIASRAVPVIVPGLAITMLIAPAALHQPWPVQPTAALIVATIAGLGLALTVPPPSSDTGSALRDGRRLVFLIAILAAGAGGAGSLATRSQTIAWLAGSVAVGLVAALHGRTDLARVLGWQVASGSALLLSVACVLAGGLPLADTSFPVLMVAALLLGIAASLPRLHPTATTDREIMTIESAGYAGGLLAVAVTLGAPTQTAAALFAFGAVLGIAAARPGRDGKQRTFLIIAACVTELFAVWVLLFTKQVAAIEAYTLPFAVLALITGIIELKYRPDLGSWVAYGPALAAGFGPTLVIVLVTDASPARRVLLITGAAITVAVGAVRRQKAPVVVGGIVTAVATLHELVLLGRFLAWPVLLALFTGTGVLLVALGATYERRRGNVSRLRGAFGRMR